MSLILIGAGLASGGLGLAGGIVGAMGTRKSVKGAYYDAYANLAQSQEKEYVARYNAEIAVKDANAKAKAIEFNADVRNDYQDHRISEVQLDQNNSGVEMVGSPLLAIADMVTTAQNDLNESNRQSDIVRTEGRAQKSLLQRTANIEYNNRGQMINGYKNKISGMKWSMAGQLLGSVGGAMGSGASGFGR